MIYCDLCGEIICKFNFDFSASGGIKIIHNIKPVQPNYICDDCARKIIKEFINNN